VRFDLAFDDFLQEIRQHTNSVKDGKRTDGSM
jgi:hypothetical protein